MRVPAPSLSTLLGGIPPDTFLRRHWQKRPLLVRQAFPGFFGLLSLNEMCALAAREDVRARLVVERPRRRRGRWELHEGPFEVEPQAMPATHWTLLVQALEAHVEGGWDILRAFSFLPAARIDDLMVSYAAPGGSVGPHDDLYDVFLLQGPGRRRWRVASTYERAFVEDAPMRVLRDFTPELDVVLEPGDMLYLPPRVAHWGTAVDGPCFTYSIGFLAPSHDALAQNFLAYLAQERAARFAEDVLYADPDLKRPHDPWSLDDAMVNRIARILEDLRFTKRDVADFSGRLLTGPKPGVEFPARARPYTEEAFSRLLRGAGHVRLSRMSRGLLRGEVLFLNGEAHPLPRSDVPLAHRLLEEREVSLPARMRPPTAEMFRRAANAGFLEVVARRAR